MTQPRKEQVKNLKTKYTRFTSTGTLFLGGGPVQTVSNTVLEAFYDNLLAATKTGTVGGAESSAPAILYGGSGPFALAAGNTFNLTISNVSGGSPMAVTVQAGDVVTLGGSPVVTTARMADRINQVAFGSGVTSAVAANVDGQLVLTSAGTSGVQTGDSVVITVAEVTPGILNVLGFSSTSSASAQGTTAPKRGIVTVSSDGLGGSVQLRKVDAAVSDALNSSMRHALAGVYVPEFAHGQPTYARLRAFPGPVVNGRNLKFSFYRTGPVRPHVVTSSGVNKSDFSTLVGADSVAVVLNFGNGQSLNFNVTFSGITTVAGVVDKFNEALSTESLAATSAQIDSTLSQIVFRSSGPYRFTSQSTRDSFFFSLNGQASIHFNPSPGIYSVDQLVTYIGAQITAAGQGAQGQAFTYTDPSGAKFAGIRSLDTDVTASSLRLLPGNPGGTVPGTFMDTLDMFGLVPGLYKAGTMAQLYGNDEVELHCPSPLPGAQLTISGSAATMAKLGLPAGVNATTANGIQPAVAPISHALLPEMMEFHEERDDYDSVVQDFDNKSGYGQLSPQDGTANVGLDQVIGPDGKLNASLLPRILGFLGLDQMKIGPGLINSLLSSSLTPKVMASHEGTGTGFANLLFESSADTSDPTLNYVLRIYTYFDTVFITTNAKITAAITSPTAFGRDSDSIDSSLIEYSTANGTMKMSFRRSTDSSTWALSAWKNTVHFDPKAQTAGNDVVRVGEALNANASEALKARFSNPVPNILYTLVYEGRGPEGTRVRFYLRLGEDDEGDVTDDSFFYITVNAKWDGSDWSKDANGEVAVQLELSTDGFNIFTQTASNNTPWDEDSWEVEHFNLSLNGLGAAIGGSLSVGGNLANQPNTPAISGFRWTDAGNKRTLLFMSDQAGPFANVPIRIYMLTGSSSYGQGFEFTYNCRWDAGLNQWYPDDSAQKSYSWVMATDRFWLLSKDAPSTNWGEDPVTGWSNYSLLDHLTGFRGYTVKDGVFRVDSAGAVSNPTPATAVRANSVYAKSMIKSWGKVRGDGPLITNVTLMDGFNCNFTGYDGGAGAYANYFATSMLNTHYAVQFSGRASNAGNPPAEPGSYFAWSGSRIHLYSAVLIGQATYGYSYYPLTGVNGVPNAFLGDIRNYFMYFTVVGAQ